MDPLSALSIAAGIVQFLDFGAKLIGTGLQIHRSIDGATENNVQLQYVVSHADYLCSKLASTQARGGTPDERKLRELAQRGHVIAEKLVGLLQSLKLDKDPRSWSAFRQAFTVKWHEGEIESLKQKMDAIRSELTLQLMSMLCEEQSTILGVVQDVAARCQTIEIQGHADILTIRQGIESILQNHDQALVDLHAKLDRLGGPRDSSAASKDGLGTTRVLRGPTPPGLNEDSDEVFKLAADPKDVPKEQTPSVLPLTLPIPIEYAALVHMLGEAGKLSNTKDVSKVWKTLIDTYQKAGLESTALASLLRDHDHDYSSIISTAAPACWNFIQPMTYDIGHTIEQIDPLSKQIPILESLRFDELPRRELDIPKAFANTYSWIFDVQVSKFANWLRSKAGVFWVSGKPGAGKSTLMKFITTHPKNRVMLETWSADKRLVVIKHFFWGTGTAMEKSYRGLLQGLVYQVFREAPDLIQTACPERWQDGRLSQRLYPSWTVQDLESALRRAIVDNTTTTSFVLFIDGLDEFAEDHFMLITRVINEYATLPHVKFCVSSRPYNVFNTAFGSSEELTFALQDMNGQDIDDFVKGKLEKDVRFQMLRQRDPRADELGAEIRKRADGVFLWVHLVVDELMKGFSEDDDIETLHMRLDLLPRTLEEFFERILESVEQVYRKYTAKSLLLAHHAREPLPIMAYAFLYEDANDSSFLTTLQIRPFSRQEINEKRRHVAKKITSWCRGLMEVVTYETENTWEPLRRYRVNFLHRTVRDFLDSYGMQQYLHKAAGSSFRPYETLACLFEAQSKVVEVGNGLQYEMVAFTFMANEALYYAALQDREDADKSGPVHQRISKRLGIISQHLKRPPERQLFTGSQPSTSKDQSTPGASPSITSTKQKGKAEIHTQRDQAIQERSDSPVRSKSTVHSFFARLRNR